MECRRNRILTGEERHPYGAYDYSFRAGNMVMANRFDEADDVLASAPAFGSLDGTTNADAPPRTLRWAKARVRFSRGDIEGARAIVSTLPGPSDDSDGIGSAHVLKAQLDCSSSVNAAQGLGWLNDEVEKQSRIQYEHSPELAWLRSLAGLCALTLGDRAKAGGYAAQARTAFTAQPYVSDYFKAPLLKLEHALRPGRPGNNLRGQVVSRPSSGNQWAG